jgi:hypothetical protein
MDVPMARFLQNKQLKSQIPTQWRFFTGGIGGGINTLFGVLTGSMLQNGMTVAGIDQYFQQGILGIMIIVSVAVIKEAGLFRDGWRGAQGAPRRRFLIVHEAILAEGCVLSLIPSRLTKSRALHEA